MSGLLQGLVWIADFSAVALEEAGGQRATVSVAAKAILARIADACNDCGVGLRELSREAIAADVGVSPETVKKSLVLWRRLGIADSNGEEVRGRGRHAVHEIDVAKLVSFIPEERLPNGLRAITKRVAGDPIPEKGVAGASKTGRWRPEKGVAGDPPTNNKDSNNSYPARAGERADGSPGAGEAAGADGPEPGDGQAGSGMGASGEPLTITEQAEREAKLCAEFILGRSTQRSHYRWLWPTGHAPIESRELGVYLEGLSWQGLSRAVSWIGWAEDLVAGRPNVNAPIRAVAEIERLIRDAPPADEVIEVADGSLAKLLAREALQRCDHVKAACAKARAKAGVAPLGAAMHHDPPQDAA